MAMFGLAVARYRFWFEASMGGGFGGFPGSAWRGAFGSALRRMVCITHEPDCAACSLVETCVFPWLFEGRRRSGPLTTLERVPVPFVFDVPAGTRFEAGDMVTVDLTLIGAANQRLPYIIHAMTDAGRRGVGPGRPSLHLCAVDRLAGLDGAAAERVYEGGGTCRRVEIAPLTPDPPDATTLEVTLRTPLRLRREGDLVGPERLEAWQVITAAMWRVSALAAFYGNGPVAADFRALRAAAGMVTLEGGELRWAERWRHSARQGMRMAMGGIVGRFRLRIPEAARAVLPWLASGQWVGVGKGASMGLGQYRLAAAE